VQGLLLALPLLLSVADQCLHLKNVRHHFGGSPYAVNAVYPFIAGWTFSLFKNHREVTPELVLVAGLIYVGLPKLIIFNFFPPQPALHTLWASHCVWEEFPRPLFVVVNRHQVIILFFNAVLVSFPPRGKIHVLRLVRPLLLPFLNRNNIFECLISDILFFNFWANFEVATALLLHQILQVLFCKLLLGVYVRQKKLGNAGLRFHICGLFFQSWKWRAHIWGCLRAILILARLCNADLGD